MQMQKKLKLTLSIVTWINTNNYSIVFDRDIFGFRGRVEVTIHINGDAPLVDDSFDPTTVENNASTYATTNKKCEEQCYQKE